MQLLYGFSVHHTLTVQGTYKEAVIVQLIGFSPLLLFSNYVRICRGVQWAGEKCTPLTTV